MYTDIASVYDQVYEQRGKDYRAEANLVAELVTNRCPWAAELLDVACGTGKHLEQLSQRFQHVEGLELSSDMRAAAEQRLGDGALHTGDMRSFNLHRQFDALTCMFSSIGYMADEHELFQAVCSMASHLRVGGVLVIEPWWFPRSFTPGYVGQSISTVDGRTVARISHSYRQEMVSIVTVHFTVADSQGIKHFVDEHSITLFERGAYERAYDASGLQVEYLTQGPTDRGVFVGTKLKDVDVH